MSTDCYGEYLSGPTACNECIQILGLCVETRAFMRGHPSYHRRRTTSLTRPSSTRRWRVDDVFRDILILCSIEPGRSPVTRLRRLALVFRRDGTAARRPGPATAGLTAPLNRSKLTSRGERRPRLIAALLPMCGLCCVHRPLVATAPSAVAVLRPPAN